MTEERIDAAIREAFEQLEPRPELVRELAPRRRFFRFEAVAVGLMSAAALALFLPWVLRAEGPRIQLDASPAYAPPSGTRIVRLEVAGAQDGWPEAGAQVDVYAASDGDVVALLTDVPVADRSRPGEVALAVDPSLAVRAVHGGQTAALTLGVVLPDGRRVVELRESSPVRVGDVVDVLVTAERDGAMATWTALRDVEVVTLGQDGPMVALSPSEALDAVRLQHRGTLRLSRHLEGSPR